MVARVPISVRVTPRMSGRLKRASAKNGRSLTQEIELRLERSFEDDEVLAVTEEILTGFREIACQIFTKADAERERKAIKSWLNAAELRHLARTGQRLDLPADPEAPVTVADVFEAEGQQTGDSAQ